MVDEDYNAYAYGETLSVSIVRLETRQGVGFIYYDDGAPTFYTELARSIDDRDLAALRVIESVHRELSDELLSAVYLSSNSQLPVPSLVDE